VRLLHDQGHLVVVLGGEEHLGAGIADLRQLGAEVGVLGGEAFVGHDGPGAMHPFPGLLEELGKALGVVARHIVQDRRFGEFELLRDEIGQHRPLERIEEAGTENVRPVFGGVGIGGPRGDHRRLVVVRDPARRNRLLGGLRSDHDEHLVLGDHLGGGLHGGFRLGLVVLDDELDRNLLPPHRKTPGGVDVLEPHLGRELGPLAYLGDITRERSVDADLDRLLCRNLPGRDKRQKPCKHTNANQ
jgi:hypothetical protein